MHTVKLTKYFDLSGDTADAFKKKVQKGVFLEGIHYKKCDDGVKWVNLLKIEEWYEIGTARQLAKYAKNV
jgi:hypothetical protein